MQGIPFPDANTVLNRPDRVAPEDCYDLPVFKGNLPDETPVVVSCWEPTVAELDEIIKTGKVWLMLWGTTHQPVCVMGHNPFNIPEESKDVGEDTGPPGFAHGGD